MDALGELVLNLLIKSPSELKMEITPMKRIQKASTAPSLHSYSVLTLGAFSFQHATYQQ